MAQQHTVRPDAAPVRQAIERLPFIEGVRGFAATVVCLRHCVFVTDSLVAQDIRNATTAQRLAWLVSPATQMVYLFLMVSAFSLLYSEDVRRLSGRATRVSVFLRRRAWRILPTYYVALVIALPIALLAARGPLPAEFEDLRPTLAGVVSHLLLVHNLHTQTWSFQINGPLWSMAYEAQLYLLFPLLYFALRRHIVTGVAVAASVFFAVYVGHAPTHLMLLYWFALGATVAAGYRMLPDWIIPVLGVAGMVALVSAWLNVPYCADPAVRDVRWSVAFVALLLWMARRPATRLNPCNTRIARWIGLRSYSFYAFHYPLLWLLYVVGTQAGLSGGALLFVSIVIGFPLAIIVAMAAYRFVELPSLKKARSISVR